MTAAILDLHHLERLLHCLDAHGWAPSEVLTAETWQPCSGAQAVLRTVAEWDAPVIKLQRAGADDGLVRLAWGLGPALLVDSYTGPAEFHDALQSAQEDVASLASADLLERLLAQVVHSGAQNYQGAQFDIELGSEQLQAIVLLQLRGRPTPHQLRMDAEEERNALRAELEALQSVVRSVDEQLRRFGDNLPLGFDRRVIKLVADAAAPGQYHSDLATPDMVH